MSEKTYVAMDFETDQIADGNLSPKIVCGAFATRGADGEMETTLLGNHPDDGLEDMVEWALTDPDICIVTQGGGFDYACICATWPRLIPLVYNRLIELEATDTLWREKLLNLSTSGRLTNLEMPDGSKVRLSYGLDALVLKYLGRDISAAKHEPTSWRTNFNVLDGWRASEYPKDAAAYASEDAELTLQVFEMQEVQREPMGFGSTETEQFQLLKSFVLMLMTAWGMMVNHEEVDRVAAHVEGVLEQNKELLVRAGILRPDNLIGPPAQKHLERAYDILAQYFGPDELPDDIGDDEWEDYHQLLSEHGVKFNKPKAKPGSLNQKRLQTYLADLYKRLGEIPKMTAGGKTEPKIACDAEVQEYLADKDPVMAQYHERSALSKIVGQMLPALKLGPVTHPSYDALKETGRTSSYDGGSRVIDGKETRLFSSVNIQQIPGLIRGIDPRQCFMPRPGTVFFDVDFTGLELACVGHVTYTLFGESVHRDLYNAGVDLHGYLGAQLALQSDPKASAEKPWLQRLSADFKTAVREEGIGSQPMAVYDAFKLLKKHEDKDVREFFKHFRSFAKPVGLGFPGGLGPATMVEFARKTYGVVMTEEEAYAYRAFWRKTYPEMPKFFDWINTQLDHGNCKGDDTAYQYVTDMGMVRRGAAFCAAANGKCMQSPGAEAALTGTVLLSRACYDPTQESVLFGCRPIAFVHDQVIGETTRDEALWAAQCEEAARLLRTGAEKVLSSIKMRTDEALLTTVWSKAAQPERNEQGILFPWKPAK